MPSPLVINRVPGMISEEKILGNKINAKSQYLQSVKITGLE